MRRIIRMFGLFGGAVIFAHSAVAQIDSGGGITTSGTLTNWNAIGGGVATSPVVVGAFSGNSGDIAVLDTLGGNTISGGDGIPDWWKILYGFNRTANIAALDSDGNGTSNLLKYLAGNNPLDSTSVFRLKPVFLNGSISVNPQTITGRSYILQFSTDLVSWSNVRTSVGDGSIQTITFTPNPDDPQYSTRVDKSKYFIRIVIQQP